MQKEGNYRKLFRDFNRLNVLVIGDVMVDAYLWGKVDRISPEAPIPIVALRKREYRMGGAANVAMNLRALGANPIPCSVIGTDEMGSRFVDLLKREGIDEGGIIRSPRRITTTKYRIFGNAFQMLRVDEEDDSALTDTDHEALLRVFGQIIRKQKIDCIIFQDYDKGVITPALIKGVVERAEIMGIPVTVDPKKKNFMAYEGVTLFKPNLKELREGINTDEKLDDHLAVSEAAGALRVKLGCRFVLTTMSEKGVMLSYDESNEAKELFVPAHMRTIADVSGAGDTVISVASLCLAMKRSPYEIAYISNLAGGLVCEEVGVVPIRKDKLLNEILSLL
jgi:rfaE bifunctional protein kinase chain/domain